MADRTAFEAAVATLTTAVDTLTTAVTSNAARSTQEIADLKAAVTAAQTIVPDGDLAAIQAAIAKIGTAVDALNVGAPAPAPAPAPAA